MRKLIARLVFGAIGLSAVTGLLPTSAHSHEGHQIECTEAGINELKIDIQAVRSGEAKTKAAKEMQMAEEMMAKKDMEGCLIHMHNAMEAMGY